MAGTITFSGLTSGLDTSSWVEALVSVKQTTITSLQAEQQAQQKLLSVVNSIKSYFSSFQTCLQKITDSQFGIAAIDLFMQNVALSSNSNIVTATATTEAARQSYDVFVDQLATATKASSGYRQTDTLNATLETTLGQLGANNGTITVNSQSFSVTKEDTIKSLIEKFTEVGVIASFDEKKSKFTISCSIAELDEGATGIKAALKLQDATIMGLTSGSRVYATANTELYKLGLTAGQVKIEGANHTITKNGNNYTIKKDGGTTANINTIGQFLDYLKGAQVNAEGAEIDDEGNIYIRGAVIESVTGGSNIKDVLQLGDVIERTVMQSNNLTWQKGHFADETSTLKDIGITGNKTLSINGAAATNIADTTTIGALKTTLAASGIDMNIDANGVITIDTNGAVMTGTILDALKLTPDKQGTTLTSAAHTVTYKATGDTLLSTLGVTNTMSYIAYDSWGTALTGSQNNLGSLTVDGFIAKLQGHGLNAYFDADNQKIIIEDGYITGTAATQLGMATETITHQEFAHKDIKLEQLGATGNQTLIIDGTTKTYAKTVTLETVMNDIRAAGGDVELKDGMMTISKVTLTGTLPALLGFEAVSQATSVTSGAISVVTNNTSTSSSNVMGTYDHNITMSSKIGDITGTTTTYTLGLDGAAATNFTKDSTLQAVSNAITAKGGTFTINDDNTISVTGVTMTGTLVTALGFASVGQGTTMTSNAVINVGGVENIVTGTNTLEQLGATGNTTLSINGTNKTYAKTTAISTILADIRTAGGNASIDENGVISISEVTLTGTTADILKLSPTYTGTAATSGAINVVTKRTGTSSAALGPVEVNPITATSTLSHITGAATTQAYTLNISGTAKNYTGATTLATIRSDIQAAGGTMSIDENGKITIEGVKLTGTAVTALGLTPTAQRTEMSSNDPIKLSQSFLITGTTTFEQLAVANSTDARSYAIYDSFGNVIQVTGTDGTTSTKNINNWLSSINSAMNTYYGTTGKTYASVSNGIITIEDGYVSGNLVTNIGMKTESVISGKQIAGSTATYNDESAFIGLVANQIIPTDISAKRVSAVSAFTTGETYYISDASDLTKLATLVNSGQATDGVTFVLTNDIDMSSAGSTVIGNASGKAFKGNFYGNGYEISNKSGSLFGYTTNATIRDVGLKNVTVSGTTYAGALAQYATNTTIENSYAAGGSVSINTGHGGGLVGATSGGSINNSYASVNVSGTATNMGGLAGSINGTTINNTYAIGNVTQSSTANNTFAGGFAGSISNANITNTYASGNVTLASANTVIGNVAGYAGNITSTKILNSYSNGNVKANDNASSRAGGFYTTLSGTNTLSNIVYCVDSTIQGSNIVNQTQANGWTGAQLSTSGNGMPDLIGKNPYIIREIQTNTTLATMGLATNSERTITVNLDGEIFTQTFAANATTQDVVNFLNGIAGIEATFEESQLRVKATTSQNLTVGGKVATVLFGGTMSETSVYATQNTDDKLYYTENNIAISNATRIGDLLGTNQGGTLNALINDTTQVTLTYNADDTISDVISDLAIYGINANVSATGVFSYTSNDKASIFGDIGRALTGPSGTVTYTDKAYESGNLNATTTPALSGSTTLASLGINSGTVQILDGNGNFVNSIDIDNTKTLDQLKTVLSSYGFTLTVDSTNKKVKIETNANQIISDGSSNLISGLKINTWTPTNTAMKTTTTMAQLGHTNGTTLTVTLDGDSTMNLSFGADNTIQDVISSLAALGINASVNATTGAFSASSTTHSFRFSGDLSTLLTTYNDTSKGYQSTPLRYNTATTKLTANSTIEDLLGVRQDGTLRLTLNDGEIINLEYTADDTIQNVIDDLANLDIHATISGTGVFSAKSDNKTFVLSGNIGRALQGNAPTYTNFDDKYVSADLSYQTTSKATNSTTLAEIGVKSGQVYVLNRDGNVINSIEINDTMTVQETKAALLSYGFNMAIDADGKITVSSNDGYSLTDGSSDMVTKFKLDTWTKTNSKLSAATTLQQMGFKDGADLNLLIDGSKPTTISFGATDTVQDIINSLDALGITASVSATNGAFTAVSKEHTFVFSGDLGKLLTQGTAGYVNTDKSYVTEDPLMFDVPVVTNTSKQLSHSNPLSPTDTVASMGFEDGGVVRLVLDGSTPYSFSFLATDTMQDIMDTLATYGIQTTIDANGKVALRNDDHAFTLGGALGSYIVNGGTYTNKDTGYTSTSHTFETTEKIDLNTKLSDLGVASGALNIVQDGEIVADNIQIDEETTIGQLFNAIEVYDMQGTILTEVGTGNTSIQIYAIGDNRLTDGTCDAVSKLGFYDIQQGDYRSHIEFWDTGVTSGLLTEDTLLTSLDKDGKTAVGSLIFDLGTGADKVQHIVNITAEDTIGSLIEKLEKEGVHAVLDNGVIKIDNSVDGITVTGGTSQIRDTLGMVEGPIDTYSTSSATLTYQEVVTYSVANYADANTTLSTVNVTDGKMSVYVDGIKTEIVVNSTDKFSDLFSRISSSVAARTGVTVKAGFLDKNGNIVTNPTAAQNTGIIAIEAVGDHTLVIGASNDTTNFATIANLQQVNDSKASGSRALYKVNINSLVMGSGLFKDGNITAGTFTIGDAQFTIDNTTTLNSLIDKINKSDKSYATAYWDTLSGTLVLQSTLTGESLINIESGTSNFTDIMGFTEVISGKETLITEMQTLGHNAKVRINGTLVTSTSNTITSDISKIKGLTLNIKQMSEGESTTITVEQDDEGIYNAVNDIVDSYNTLMEGLEKEIAEDGPFSHDSMFKTMYNKLKRIITQTVGGTTIYKNLAAIGISTGEAQDSISTDVTSLIIDKDKFMQCLEDNSDAVKQLIVGTTTNPGVFLKINGIVDSTLKTTGYLSATEKTINKNINKLGDKISDLSVALARYREQLQTKFSAMERTISDMQTAYVSFLN